MKTGSELDEDGMLSQHWYEEQMKARSSFMDEWNRRMLFGDVDMKKIPREPKFWLSIKPKNQCLFSRRLGIKGKLILGRSVRLRLFGKDII